MSFDLHAHDVSRAAHGVGGVAHDVDGAHTPQVCASKGGDAAFGEGVSDLFRCGSYFPGLALSASSSFMNAPK